MVVKLLKIIKTTNNYNTFTNMYKILKKNIHSKMFKSKNKITTLKK